MKKNKEKITTGNQLIKVCVSRDLKNGSSLGSQVRDFWGRGNSLVKGPVGRTIP